jgi:hypothetical protein
LGGGGAGPISSPSATTSCGLSIGCKDKVAAKDEQLAADLDGPNVRIEDTTEAIPTLPEIGGNSFFSDSKGEKEGIPSVVAGCMNEASRVTLSQAVCIPAIPGRVISLADVNRQVSASATCASEAS